MVFQLLPSLFHFISASQIFSISAFTLDVPDGLKAAAGGINASLHFGPYDGTLMP